MWDNSDPGVLVDGGRTYVYGSTNNMALPVREVPTFQGDLTASKQEWDAAPHNAMSAVPKWVNPADPEIWAPSAIRLGNRYWVYFAGHRKGATDLWDDQCIGRAFATSPMGPFTPEADPIYCGYRRHGTVNPWGWGTLDPEVFRAADNKLYLLAALSGTRDNIGSLRLDTAGKVIGGLNATPTTLVTQRFDFHDGIEDGRMGPEAFLENPTMTYDAKSKTYLLFYSAGRWDSSRYVTGFARCLSPQGPCTPDHRGPFLSNGPTRTGAGGFTVFTDAHGTVRAAYSTWQTGMEGERGVPNPYGLYSRHLTWARLQTTGTNPASQVVKLLPA